jgi:hypothetical protein
MNFSVFSMLPWLLITFLIGAIHITSSVILLRQRHISAWMMLTGSCIALLGQVGFKAYEMLWFGGRDFIPEYLLVISAFTNLGALLFAIGLLFHVFQLRSKSSRIQELEAIIASLQKP